MVLAEAKIEAFIADPGYRKRDGRYADQDLHRAKPDPLHDKGAKPDKPALFRPRDFEYDTEHKTCVCPAGKQLYGNGSNCLIHGYQAIKFQGARQDCGPCALRARCLRTPEKTATRQVAITSWPADRHPEKNRTAARQGFQKRVFLHPR